LFAWVANILEFTAGFRASVTHDEESGSIGAVQVGSLSKKFDVIVDPYFLRNVLLIGRRGNSFLESGYVYAPYVPLQTTPTIFGPEDFVPRKGVMTRYAKKMVRPDMYGLVICRGLLGESGSWFNLNGHWKDAPFPCGWGFSFWDKNTKNAYVLKNFSSNFFRFWFFVPQGDFTGR